MMSLLALCEVEPYVRGEILQPDRATDLVGYDNWRKNDSYAKHLITQNMGDESIIHIQYQLTSHVAWKNLEAIYKDKSQVDSLLEMIETHPVFFNDAYTSQSSVNIQLAVAMFRFGHNGNGASVEAVAHWAGVSAGTVVNCMRRVMIAFLALHDSAIRWPSEDEKEELKKWVEMVSCYEWRDGYCMVDGTPVVLFQKPGYHGEAYFDRKSNYSLNLQVRLTSIPCACICYNSDSLLPCQIFA